ncbi:hypothetical protein, conserved [Eimeria necatrix]|uniref:Uncharacterized protein n=1 Tax=Eimeria necatrix TaxID=51315 RepID=U6MM19_9EIME|nr:hypothetical protein, conserved [Eimeria necatrix]CDJ65041.1 hypothetical protein, conserved [Eimeria necatrix]
MSSTRSVSMSNIQKKSAAEHLLFFGPIAKSNWTLAAEKGALKVEAYLDARPLLHMLQGRRVKDFLLADDALSMEENVGTK